MTEKEAIKKFYECANNDDLTGCLEVLQEISVHTINEQDDDGYNMLISAAVAGNPCAVEALIKSGKCDLTLEESLCGLSAADYAMHYEEDSRIRTAVLEAPQQNWLYREGQVIRKEELLSKLMDGSLEADAGCFTLLDDTSCVELLLKGKVAQEDFEAWTTPDGIDWRAQLMLLANNEEFGKKFVSWEHIRMYVEPDEWLSFLRDLPRYADKADWNKLIKEGSKASWEALVNARPEFKDKYQQWDDYRKKMLQKYTNTTFFPPFNLAEACKHNDIEVVKFHLNNTSQDLNKNHIYPMPPGFPAELPLAAAVKYNALECIELLLEHGADPDVCCNHKSNYKTPRELAAGKPEILEIFNIYKGEKKD